MSLKVLILVPIRNWSNLFTELANSDNLYVSIVLQDNSLTVNHAYAVHLVDLIADLKYKEKILALFMGYVATESSGEAIVFRMEIPQSTSLMDDSINAIH